MTAESGGKGRGAGRPDLLASLPAEDPPASPPAPGIDPAAVEELLTGMRDLREQVAGLREAVSAERSAPEPEAESETVPEALTREALEAWGDNLVARVAEAARTEAAPKDDAAAARIERIEDAAAKAAAAAERVDGGLDSTADRVAAGIGEAAARIETGLAAMRDHVMHQAGLVNVTLEVIRTQTAGPKFGWRMVLVGLIVFVLGMVLESYGLVFYRWFRAD